jgi:uncharacterized protein
MLSMIALPDIHSVFEQIHQIKKQLAEVDVVLLVGDMTNGRRQDLVKLIDLIKQSNPEILAVGGNHDDHQMDAYLEEAGLSIHGRYRIIKDVAFIGCGGALPLPFMGNYVFNEEQYTELLSKMLVGLDPKLPKVFVCHQPPYKTRLDKNRWGFHAGSKSIRKFIEESQALVCFTGHAHVSLGIDTLGTTKLVNSGPIKQTKAYSYAEIDNGKLLRLEIREI